VTGRVVDRVTGRPVPGCVDVESVVPLPSATTFCAGADGRWEVEGLAAGQSGSTSRVPGRMSRDGGRPPTRPRPPRCTSARRRHHGRAADPVARGGVLGGRVLDSRGRPVAGAGVSIAAGQWWERPEHTTTTDTAGRYRLANVRWARTRCRSCRRRTPAWAARGSAGRVTPGRPERCGSRPAVRCRLRTCGCGPVRRCPSCSPGSTTASSWRHSTRRGAWSARHRRSCRSAPARRAHRHPHRAARDRGARARLLEPHRTDPALVARGRNPAGAKPVALTAGRTVTVHLATPSWVGRWYWSDGRRCERLTTAPPPRSIPGGGAVLRGGGVGYSPASARCGVSGVRRVVARGRVRGRRGGPGGRRRRPVAAGVGVAGGDGARRRPVAKPVPAITGVVRAADTGRPLSQVWVGVGSTVDPRDWTTC
jgi:hypothetical protein